MPHNLYYKNSPKSDPLALKCIPNLHNIMDCAKIFTIETRFELEFNSIIFVKIKLWIKEIWHIEVTIIYNVDF